MCEVFERRFSLINSSHRYSTQPNYRSTPNYPTKTKARVPLSLFVALRLFSRADSRSGVHITRFSQKNKMCGISTIWRKMCGISFFLILDETLYFIFFLKFFLSRVLVEKNKKTDKTTTQTHSYSFLSFERRRRRTTRRWRSKWTCSARRRWNWSN